MKENNTTSTSTSSSYTIGGYNFISSCKYRLPCGICDRTGDHCTEFLPVPELDPYLYRPWQVTYAQNTSIDAGHIKTGTITANTEVNL